MENEDLSKTKPIKKLENIEKPEDVKISREEKYKDIPVKEDNEAAEEALAEKNINEAESLLEQEEEALEDVDPVEVEEEIYESDKKGFAKLVDKWKHLDKSKKLVYGLIATLVLILIVLFIVALVLLLGDKKIEEQVEAPENQESIAEQPPEIIYNYYYKDGELHLVDKDENELGVYKCVNQNENNCYVAKNNHRDKFDVPKLLKADGSELVRVLPIYENNYVFIFDNKSEKDGNLILYSISDEKTMGTYTEVKGYSDDYVIVADTENKYGLLHFVDGVEETIKNQYSYLGMIDGEENLIAKSAKGYMVINKNNKIQSKAIPGNVDIKYYNDDLVVAMDTKGYKVFNYDAEMLSEGHSFILINKNYAGLVDNGRVKVIDDEGLKYNEDGIVLKNKDYVKIFIYDENDVLSESKKSFSIEIKDDAVGVVVYDGKDDKYTYLDKNVPKVNANYKYMSYYDGKLYFYKDADKKELAGNYSCGTKNEVNKETKQYNECTIAHDTVFEDNDSLGNGAGSRSAYAPIINGRYVFIKDQDSIYLYDLNQGKAVSTYNKINTYTEANDNIVSYNGELNIVALNKKGLFGMIRITASKPDPVYAFVYNHIEKVGDVYIGLKTDGTWIVFPDQSVTYPEKIQGHNKNKTYFKAKGSSYHVYDSFGNVVSKDDFEYVELYDDFYAGVLNKEVWIYDYDGNKISTQGVKVSNTNYARVADPAFKVKKENGKYIVQVLEGDKYVDYSTEAPSGSGNAPEEPENKPE